jgi:hypothetical protein
MNLGAEPKKVLILVGLVAVAGYFLYSNFTSKPERPPASAASSRAPASGGKEALSQLGRPAPRAEAPAKSSESSTQAFRPSLKPRKSVDFGELNSMDTTLRLDLLAKLQESAYRGEGRSLFEFSVAPAPKTPAPKVIAQPVAPPPPPPPVEARKPAAPPIPLKFFGFTTPFQQNVRRAFFLDGEEILVAAEGEILKKRYRVVRIGVNNVVMEDLDFKAEQTLPLEPQVG